MNRIVLSVIGLLFSISTHLQAQEFVAVKVEAENFASKHPDWRTTTTSSTPNVQPDPDGSHAGSASGRAYMELLPDTRVTHGDPLVSGGNFWNEPGTGPSLSYNVNIPESGRYLVFVKAYSTGTEDNGIHVGLNNSNPASGARMQWCSGKNQWTWSSAQRTNSNHCGVPRTIFLDFSFAGANTVTFSAREDGFEFDQFILLKTSNNSCTPNNNDQIVCNTGTTSIPAQPTTPAPAPAPVPAPVAVPAPQPAPVAAPVAAPEPAPAPVAAPAPVPTVQPAAQPAAAPDQLPVCQSAASDPDGDGFGWENNQSCTVSTTTAAAVASPAPAAATPNQLPICQSAASDPDGDGYGWEQNSSCLVNGADVAAQAAPSGEFCQSASSDPDGDGWGWENSRSCRVR